MILNGKEYDLTAQTYVNENKNGQHYLNRFTFDSVPVSYTHLGTYYNTISGYDEMRTLWFPALQDAINGGDVQSALDHFAEQANTTIK